MSGKSISELSTLRATEHLKGSDLFVFSLKNTDNTYSSKSILYTKLSNELSITLSGVIGKDRHVYLTKAQYDALTPAQRKDTSKIYCTIDEDTGGTLTNALLKTGGTMIGSLILSGDPHSSNEAANKHYVDAVSCNIVNNMSSVVINDMSSDIRSYASVLSNYFIGKNGGIISAGSLILSGDPQSDNEAATKHYVDLSLNSVTFECNNEVIDTDILLGNLHVKENMYPVYGSSVLSKTIENYIKNLIKETNMNCTVPIDSSKYYRSEMLAIKDILDKDKGSIDLLENPLEIKQDLIIKLNISYSAKRLTNKISQKIEIHIIDSNNTDTIYDVIYPSVLTIENKEYWFNISVGSKIYAKVYSIGSDITIVTDWDKDAFNISIFSYSDAEFLDYLTTKIHLNNRHIVTETFTATADGKLLVNGKTNFWTYADQYCGYYYNGNAGANYINRYDDNNKLVERINIRSIPTLQYARDGYYLENPNNNYYVFGNPVLTPALSGLMLQVVPTSVDINNIKPYISKEAGYRFINNKNLSVLYSSLSSDGIYVADNDLYNMMFQKWKQLSLVKLENAQSKYGKVVLTIEIDNAIKSYQFNEIEVKAGESYCLVYNGYANNNINEDWNFNFCETTKTEG